ncbi:putative lyase [Rosa chinensis]|uniref:Putative lyase n=1 Tax=Rosa chinensis TaxID=74649 RepID=A0A2P6QHM0_ROSCH|nr:putative lyase [Rosa chinensis]
MSPQVLASQAQRPDTVAHIKRPSTNYAPSIWGDHFLSYATMEVNIELEQHVRELKEEVKSMLMDPVKNPSQQLDLVDDIQRLGVSYHFENEIDGILKQIHNNYSSSSDDDLYNVFNKFKEGNDQKFKASLLSDVSGLLSLYEATHLKIHGEDILEEALAFTTTHLESIKHSLSPSLSQQVAHSLNQPLRKGIPRVEARYYLWWKDLDVTNKLPFTRDRITEIYLTWALSVYFEPQYAFGRRTSCKVTAMTSIIDDIYDNQGTLEELELFTEAIKRSYDTKRLVLNHIPTQMPKKVYLFGQAHPHH